MTTPIVFLACLLAAAGGSPQEGAIDGIVINRSDGGRPAVAVEVELRAELDGQMVPVARTETDKKGRFVFLGVPLDRTLTYMAGANLEGVYYASSKFALGPARHSAHVRLEVREAETGVNPLVIHRHDIVIEPDLGALHVTEALLIDNPTKTTYVGRAGGDAPMPVTFELGIPTDFERLTFEEEYFGRNFALVGGRLVTSVPWEPGRRWVRFTYSSRNEQAYRRWQRRIDAPCEQLTVRVIGGRGNAVECSLPRLDADGDNLTVFASSDGPLAAGDLVWVGMGDLPVSWMAYARWGAVVVLAAAIAGLSLWMRRRRRATNGRRPQRRNKHRPSRSPMHRRAA